MEKKAVALTHRYSLMFLFCTCGASVLNVLLLTSGFVNFLLEFVLGDGARQMKGTSFLFNRQVFLIDFYVFFALFTCASFFLLWDRKNRFYILSFLIMQISANLCLYTVPEIFSVKIFMYSAFVVTVAVKLPLVKSIVLNAIGITSFVVCQFYPSVMGIVDTADTPAIQSWQDFFSLVVSLVCIGSVLAAYRYAIEKWQESDATKKHINLVMSQMTNINAQLQEFAKNKGEQAAEEERMRITRDMHDSCGYVFVNIIGLMEACLSGREMEWSKTQETFETVRNLAKHGLQETRKTLRAIRDVESPVENSLDALFEIKSIFQKVTGITVDLDRGNMKSDYGRTINKILIRTMQEGLTNAVRHGLATYVAVFFREDGDYLFMTVKDNGIGSKQVVKGIGLAGMEERLAKVGGTLFAGDSADGGFKLEIQIPVVHLLMEEYGSEKTKTAAG